MDRFNPPPLPPIKDKNNEPPIKTKVNIALICSQMCACILDLLMFPILLYVAKETND